MQRRDGERTLFWANGARVQATREVSGAVVWGFIASRTQSTTSGPGFAVRHSGVPAVTSPLSPRPICSQKAAFRKKKAPPAASGLCFLSPHLHLLPRIPAITFDFSRSHVTSKFQYGRELGSTSGTPKPISDNHMSTISLSTENWFRRPRVGWRPSDRRRPLGFNRMTTPEKAHCCNRILTGQRQKQSAPQF
jgi:hypothetical protein